MLRDPRVTGFGDWQMIHHNWEAAYVSLKWFGEWPLWDPFHCGGVPILGNPESQVYAPWFWVSFALGTVLAVKVMLLGHVVSALTGVYWLARCRYQLRASSAALGALVWGCGGWLVWDGAGGHATFFAFAYAPWLSLLVHRRREPLREAAGVAALLLLTLLEGGTYPLPYFVLFVAFELAVRALSTRTAAPCLRFAGVSFGLLAVCGAIRLVPIYLSLKAHPRTVPNDDALALAEVWQMLTARAHAWRVPGHPFAWPEYGSYIGITALALAALGLLRAVRGRWWHLLLGLGLWGSLMLGNLGTFAPFSLLHKLPVYDSLRVPSRFAVFVTLYLALLAAHGCEALLRRVSRPRLATALGMLLAAGVCADLLGASMPIVRLWREPPLADVEARADQFHLVNQDYYRFYASYPRLNLGTPTCYAGGMNWTASRALWLGALPQVRVAPDAGRVLSWTKTPHVLRAEVELTRPARVITNQNYAPAFRSHSGTPVDDRGRLALDLPAGKHTVELSYLPRELRVSAAVSCGGLALMLWLLLAGGPRRSSSDRARDAE